MESRGDTCLLLCLIAPVLGCGRLGYGDLAADAGPTIVDAAVTDAMVAPDANMDITPDACVSSCQPQPKMMISGGESHTCALLLSGVVKCWGRSSYGQLGLGDLITRGDDADEMGADLPAVDLGTGQLAIAIVAGSYHSCAILDDNSVKCWGSNAGQLGIGDTVNRGIVAADMGDNLPAVELGSGRTAVSITAGESHTCALLDNTSIKCWGSNIDGQLGLGDYNDRGDLQGEMGDALPAVDLGSGRTALAVAAGWYHTCAILDDGSVKCWGDNGDGQLGLGDTIGRGGPGEMGDALPVVELGSGRTALAISAGWYHSCAILDDNSVKCWGQSYEGQLGLGNSDYHGTASGEMGDNLPPVDLGTGRTAKTISSGTFHTCALLDDDSVKCWGNNGNGEIGIEDDVDRGSSPNQMGDNLPAVNLGEGSAVKAVIAGKGYHNCAILTDDSVKCWGGNWDGQLGLGDSVTRGDDVGEMGDNLPVVSLDP